MNLNEQLQQAYNAGRRQGLNEQGGGGGRLDHILRTIRKNPHGGQGGINVTPQNQHLYKPNVFRNPNDPSLIPISVNWRQQMNNGLPPSWWTGTFEEFNELFNNISGFLDGYTDEALGELGPLMEDFINTLFEALYNPGNGWDDMLNGTGNFTEFLQNPVIQQLLNQGWQLYRNTTGHQFPGGIRFIWNPPFNQPFDGVGPPFFPGSDFPVPGVTAPPIPEGPLGELGQILSDFFEDAFG